MRSSIEIDDERSSSIVGSHPRGAKALAELKGLGWEGNLSQMREGCPPR